MFKKEQFQILTDRYSDHAYTGLMGYFMKYCHKQLEINQSIKRSKILEIGAGGIPHKGYINHPYDEYHIIEKSSEIMDFYKNKSDYKLHLYDGKILPFDDESFDRIIICHCLEHITEPEKFIFEMMKKLKKNGVLSISLPTDPGLLFRLGRLYLKIFSIKKKYKISKEEFDYMNATEHVNSIFGLISIIKYHFKNSLEEFYLPFRIKIPDLNLFYNVHIYKN